jgi:sugar lactone lactonase YvrE
MVVLRDPGEVFLAGHTFGGDSRAWVERLDEDTLAPVARSPDLPAGPWWPGGIAAHGNGSLYVTCGRWCHRLAPDCSPLAARELPRERPYNSLLVLPDGNLVMKDLVLDRSEPSRLVVLEPERLAILGDEVEVPEPSIARISADGDVVYVLGDSTAFRFRWQPGAGRLVRDESWSVPYRQLADQSYAWDAVVEGGQLWFMDNGEHRYAGTMRGAGVAQGPLHLVRAALDTGAFELIPVCGLPAGAITNPPCFDPERRIAIAFDSANAVLAAFRFVDGLLHPLWSKPLGVASHMIRYPDTGELVVNDHGDGGDALVVLDIESGAERARAATGSPVQSVVFPAAGFGRDLWYCSFARVARLIVT